METSGGSCVTPHAADYYHGLRVAIKTAIVCMELEEYMYVHVRYM